MDQDFESFRRDCAQAATRILSHIDNGEPLQIFSHIDADGITAGSILARAVYRAGGDFNLRIIKTIDSEFIKQTSEEKHRACVFTEIGSGYLDLFTPLTDRDLIVIDHHKPAEASIPNLTHVNPVNQGFDGGKDVSGAGVTYFVAREMDERNKDLACLAIVGALGDIQDKNKKRMLQGLNSIIIDDAVKGGLLAFDTDLLFHGHATRPLHKAIASTMHPFIPGLTREEDKALAFLVNIGIEPKTEERWRSIEDLSAIEKQTIFSEISKHLSSIGYSSDLIAGLIGTVYTFIMEQKLTPLRDAREFATLMNACAKQEKSGISIALCLGERGSVLKEAESILTDYRQKMGKQLGSIHNSPDRVRHLTHITHVTCQDLVDENLLSPIATIMFYSGEFDESKPLLLSTRTERGELKISARAHENLVGMGLHIGKVMQNAAEQINGRGGGHNVAAGATIPVSMLNEFAQKVNQLVEDVITHSHS